MIDDTALFRPTAVTALTVRPLDVSGPLPPFSPKPPRGGWTPRAVFDAALAYARDEAADLDLTDRRIVALAMRSLYVALPSTVKHAQIAERLAGVDHYADYIEPLRPSPRSAAAPVDTAVEADDLAVDPAPF